MSPKPDVAIGQIIEYLSKVYGIDARHVGLAPGGDAEVTVYRVDCDEGPLFLKLRQDQPRNPPLLAR